MNWKYHNPKFEYEEKFKDDAWPWAGHKFFAYDLVANIKPKRIVELGTHYGTSLWSFAQAVKDNNFDTELNAVDIWKGEKHAGFYGEEVFETVNQIKDKYYSDLKINLIRKKFDDAVSDFKDESIDILHIDGLHTYEAVKHDFESWLPKVKVDGIILFHDIKVGESDFGVYQLWGELKKQYRTIEFHHSFGLGVLFKNKNAKNEILDKQEELQRHYYYLHESVKNGKLSNSFDIIKQKDQEVNNLNQSIQQKDQEIQQKEQEFANFNQTVQQKDQELANLNQTVQQKDQEINNQANLIQQKDQEIIKLNKIVRRLNRKIFNANGIICRIPHKLIRHLLGMAVKVYKERGFLSMIKRTIDYLKEYIVSLWFFLSVRKNDVLYISGCPGSSMMYRCYHQAEELKKYGIKSVIVSQDNLNLLKLIGRFKIFIFQRVIYKEHIKNVIKSIKKQNKTIIFETDDLVFDPQYISQMHYYNHMCDEEKCWYQNGIGREILENPYVKNCVVSTDFLAKVMREKYPDKNIFISYNKLSKNQVKWAHDALRRKAKIKPNDGKIRIGYFSGSKSHDRDFETIADILIKILKENKNVILMIVGHLELNKKFDQVENQIERQSFVPLKKLSELILRSDINIASLEIDNPFCQAKSALKYFEAGILEVPTIATATDSFEKVIENEKTGFLAKNSDDWYKYFNLLIKNEKLRKEAGQRARIDSLEKHITQKNHSDTKRLAEFIKEKM